MTTHLKISDSFYLVTKTKAFVFRSVYTNTYYRYQMKILFVCFPLAANQFIHNLKVMSLIPTFFLIYLACV